MTLPGIASRTDLQDASVQLQQALYNHEQWAEALVRTIICGLPRDSRDMAEDAHRHCRFGHWCVNEASSILKSHPSFLAIEDEHRHMHALAAHLLRTPKGEPINQLDYDNFSSAMRRLRLQVETMRREVEQSLNDRDPLTSTLSRLGMFTRLREQYELVKRGVQSCMIAMIDIDRFKTVNDSLGHAAGDAALVSLARYITDHMRPYDLLFRYGGEEFLLCAPNLDEKTGLAMVERLRVELETLPLHAPNGREFSITVSIGMTALDAGTSVEKCVERADRAMYAAKAAGRNRTCVWSAALDQG